VCNNNGEVALAVEWPVRRPWHQSGQGARISISGNHRISEQAIRSHISSRQGEPFNVGTVDSDLKAIYHMGAFTRVRSRLERKGNQEILVILVDEKQDIGPFKLEHSASN
jgi:outer membrane protein assembly factor BamA